MESTAAAQISDNLAEKKKTASLDEFSNGVYYSIHFGSFRSLSEAEERIELLKSKGHAWWKKVVLEGKDVWYRVYIGKFKTDAEALTFGKALIFPGISDKICIYKLKSID